SHISHRLVRLGLSRRDSVLVLYGAAAATSLPALAMLCVSARGAWLIAAVIAIGLAISAASDCLAARRLA
ncbi:hypothetical protein ACFL6X_09365, partial [Candidatus Latescibacterota bacterium]